MNNNMDISSAKYLQYEGQNNCVVIVSNNITIHVPMSLDNETYVEILRRVDNGDLVIQDAD